MGIHSRSDDILQRLVVSTPLHNNTTNANDQSSLTLSAFSGRASPGSFSGPLTVSRERSSVSLGGPSTAFSDRPSTSISISVLDEFHEKMTELNGVVRKKLGREISFRGKYCGTA